jgi:hypothetical protein
MRAHDLVEPEIRADDQSFVVSLKHQSVFSEEDQRWIGGYEAFNLERDEEKALLLGRRGDPLSIQQIMDALDLVDTEDYRALVERLQHKGLIIGIPRRRSGERSRRSPRWTVVQPKEALAYYGELAAAAHRSAEENGRVRRAHMKQLISSASPYHQAHLVRALHSLKLVDADGSINARLLSLIEALPTNEPRDAESASGRAAQPTPQPSVAPDEDIIEAGVHAQSESSEEAAEQDAELAAPDRAKLYVGNLRYSTTVDAVADLFRTAGAVAAVAIPTDFRNPSRNRGFAFVAMETPEDAKRAKVDLQGADLDGRRLYLEWARSAA